jgi:4-hydroxybenzoate polyprenyltransferase
LIRKIRIFLEMIKFEHTLFALPFAYMGALLGSMALHDRLPYLSEIGWITLAMVGSRSAAMGLNRVIDKTIDMKNPRTAMRAIPAGLLKSKEVIVIIVISFIMLFFATSNLSPLSMNLLPIAVFFLVFYSYTKRFTWFCHVFLGLTIALAPLGGWIAITGSFSFAALVLFISVAFWIAGFDIIYACQDYEFDRKEGLYSIPSRFGISRSLIISRLFHFITAIGFLMLYWLSDLGWLYLIGLFISYVIMIYEHTILKPYDLSRLNTAFFTMNGVLSCVMFTFTLIDLVILS